MGTAALVLPPGDIFIWEKSLSPAGLTSAAGASGFRIYQMNTRGLCSHLGLTLAPIDKYLQVVKTNFGIAVRGIHELIPVNAYIDFLQAPFRQGHCVAVAENMLCTTPLPILVGRRYIHQPQLVSQALGLDFQITKLKHKILLFMRGGRLA